MALCLWLRSHGIPYGERTKVDIVSGQQALSRGGKVIATARKVDKISQLKHAGAEILQMDVTSAQSELDAKAAKAISIFGRIDVLVSNAAFKKWVSGGYETYSEDDYVKRFKTNVFDTINTTRAFLPYFRRAGTMINIGSMSAWECTLVSGATDALDQEVGLIGIKTPLVEAGQLQAQLLSSQSSMYAESSILEYGEAIYEASKTFRGVHRKQRGHPVKGVARIGWPKDAGAEFHAVYVIRKKCEETLRMLAEWDSFSSQMDAS
ncbi:putative short-chain oxidoreductase [Aspergillus keveii]|uniref:Short-chain oxidoreductase n=1 Tax=Aspergillus keveii TaxID=714993 RepID=A0ABR4FK07_9EURO